MGYIVCIVKLIPKKAWAASDSAGINVLVILAYPRYLHNNIIKLQISVCDVFRMTIIQCLQELNKHLFDEYLSQVVFLGIHNFQQRYPFSVF